MSLRSKTMVSVLGLFLLFALLDYGMQEWFVFPSFRVIERKEAVRGLEKCLEGLDRSISQLVQDTRVLATDQPLIEAVTNGDARAASEFLAARFHSTRGIAFGVLLSRDGTVLASANRAGDTGDAPFAPPPGLSRSAAALFARLCGGGDRQGLWLTRNGPVFVAAYPVGAAEAAVPRAWLVTARPLDSTLRKTVHGLEFAIEPLPPAAVDGGRATTAVVEHYARKVLEVECVRLDVFGRPVLTVRVRMPRDVMAQARRARLYVVASILIGGFSLLLLFLALFERNVLSQLTQFGRAVDRVALTRDLSTRLPVRGRDEIAHLAGGINIMLAALERSDAELRASETRFRMLFREMLSGFGLHEVICDADGKPVDYRFLDVNPAFERQSGLKAADVIGRTAREVLPTMSDELIRTYGEVALTGNPVRFETYVDALKRHFDITVFCPAHGQFATVFRDITDRKRADAERARMQTQFQQAQKLESLGVLAGGLAHDFNNLLVGILGNVQLVRDELPAEAPLRALVANIESAALRAADLCRQMLAYSGKGKLTVEMVNISKTVGEMERLLAVPVAGDVVLDMQLDGSVPPIMADATQVHQVAVNLITNAAEALEDRGGTIRVSTGSMTCDAAYLADTVPAGNASPGEYVYLDVTDDGCGMDTRTQSQIFDPFYTTKFIGRGLGLAAVLGIVRGHDGAIKVVSAPGEGTRMRVLFPVAPVAELRAEDGDTEAAARQCKGWGTVILADDDESVRIVGKRMLEKAGFNVLAAEDGREAVALFERFRSDVTCVLLDLTMPAMDGVAAFDRIRELDSDVPVVILSGYASEDVISEFGQRDIAGFVQKPFQISHFLSVVCNALSQTD